MRFSVLLLATLASMVVANPTPAQEASDALNALNANCGWPNGNCYDNGCEGDKSSDGITCTAGAYKGCQCGYGCGRNTGRCDQNNCNGRGGRCTGAYRGCSCRNP